MGSIGKEGGLILNPKVEVDYIDGSNQGNSIKDWQEELAQWRAGYVDTVIIKGVDLELCKGEVLGLIGESGAGKSTMGAAAMGYARDGTRISDGSINFSGIDLTTASEKQKRSLRGAKIAYVAQSAAASFNPAHKIIDQHTEAPRFHNLMTKSESEADAIDLYNRLQLPYPNEIGFRYPHQVSGGQLQRAMTAMAMSCRPDLIIFDEPTTALDVTTQIEVLAAIRDIVDQFQTAAIYITHDLAVVAQMADRIKVLLKGEEVEEETTENMLIAPKKDYTKSLWAVRSYKRDQKSRPSSSDSLISLQSINASYAKGPQVLEGVSIDFFKGTTVAVVGESGSGKSTTARCISGLLPPSTGSILFDGKKLPPNFKDRTKNQLQQIQMIYQMADTALNPKIKMSKMGEYQELGAINGLQISSVSADLYGDGRDDLSLFFFEQGANFAAVYTSSSIVSASINWNLRLKKHFIKALFINCLLYTSDAADE